MPFPIPDEIDPENTVCVPVYVPLNDAHIDAFWGALSVLGKHWEWEDNIPDTTGAVSRVWQGVIEAAHLAMGSCDMSITNVVCHCVPSEEECACEYHPETATLELWLRTGLTGAPGPQGPPGEDGEDGADGVDGSTIPAPEIVAPTGTEEEKKTVVFSGAMNIITYIQEKILEFFEAAEFALSTAHAVAEWFHQFPLIETFSPVDNAIAAADELLEATLAQFEANDTQELREELACEIFCIVVANDYVFDVYTWNLTLLLWSTKLLENLARPHYFTMATFWPFAGLANRYLLGQNDGNEDWQLLCGCETTPCGNVTFDSVDDLPYTVVYGSIGAVGNPGNGVDGAIWVVPPYATGRRAEVLIDTVEDKNIASLTFSYNYHSFEPGGEIHREIILYDAAMVVLAYWPSTVGVAQDVWHLQNVALAASGVRYVRVSARFVCNCVDPTHIWLDNILLHCS